MKVTLIQQTADPLKFIADIASICYGKDEAKDPLKLVRHLYANGHHSVFEHVYFTFKSEGISRACSHQLVRHRMCSYTQRSQRYCDESQSQWVLPPAAQNSPAQEQFSRYMEQAHQAYQHLIENGLSKEDARYVLPNAAATDIYLSCNLRELIHIAHERLCVRAQWEIREMTSRMVALVDKDLQFMLVRKCQDTPPTCSRCAQSSC